MSSTLSTKVLSSLDGLRSVRRTRRDFLSWLAAGTTSLAVGCASTTDDDSLGLGGDAVSEDDLRAAEAVCRAMTRDAKGPYFEPGSPFRPTALAAPEEPGVRLGLEGTLFGPDCRTPLPGYLLDVWQADASGAYHGAGANEFRLRGKIRTDALGRYTLETILPGRYGDAAGIRPAHLHVTFLTPGGNVLLTSQLYFEGDPFLAAADYCTRQGSCNSADPRRHLRLTDALVGRQAGKRASFDAVLPRT